MKEIYLLLKLGELDNFIIGKLNKETDEDVIIEYPISIRLTPNAMGTTSVSTTKMLPFSKNNLVVVMKTNIIAMSAPNDKIIAYYLQFIEKYGKMYDEVLENDILGIRAEPMVVEPEDESDVDSGDNVVSFRVPVGNNSIH
jgi:hypothetical protein